MNQTEVSSTLDRLTTNRSKEATKEHLPPTPTPLHPLGGIQLTGDVQGDRDRERESQHIGVWGRKLGRDAKGDIFLIGTHHSHTEAAKLFLEQVSVRGGGGGGSQANTQGSDINQSHIPASHSSRTCWQVR